MKYYSKFLESSFLVLITHFKIYYNLHLYPGQSTIMAEKFRKFANAAAAMAVSFSRPNYFESGKKGKIQKALFLNQSSCSQ